MREQLTAPTPYPTRRYIATGALAAGSLGELLAAGRKRPRQRQVCEAHYLRNGKWFFRCVNCGHIVDFHELTSATVLAVCENPASN